MDREIFPLSKKEFADRLGLQPVAVQAVVKQLKAAGAAIKIGNKWFFSLEAEKGYRSLGDGRGRPPSPGVKNWKTGKSQNSERISFANPELLWRVLTAKRWELLNPDMA